MSLMICSEGVFAVPDFCLIFAPRLATMSQKSSFPHPTDSVQYVLTSNIPLLAVPSHQWRAAAASILIHEAHGLLASVVLRPFSLLTEVDPGAITLARPINVLKPAEMALKFFGDSKNTGRHRAVVV